MPNFNYTAIDGQGNETTGVLSADSNAQAIEMLKGNGLYPTQVVEEGIGAKGKKGKSRRVKVKTGGRIKTKALMIFTRQLATLIDSGLPLLRSLTVLGKQEPNPVQGDHQHAGRFGAVGIDFFGELGGSPQDL